MTIILHDQLYQITMAKAYDNKIHLRKFKEGDLVLRKILLLPSKNHSKWAPNYEGLYVVKKTLFGRELLPIRMDGKDLIRPIEPDFVKKYYVWFINSHHVNKMRVWPRNILFAYSSFPSLTYGHLLIPKNPQTHIYNLAWSYRLTSFLTQIWFYEKSFPQ